MLDSHPLQVGNSNSITSSGNNGNYGPVINGSIQPHSNTPLSIPISIVNSSASSSNAYLPQVSLDMALSNAVTPVYEWPTSGYQSSGHDDIYSNNNNEDKGVILYQSQQSQSSSISRTHTHHHHHHHHHHNHYRLHKERLEQDALNFLTSIPCQKFQNRGQGIGSTPSRSANSGITVSAAGHVRFQLAGGVTEMDDSDDEENRNSNKDDGDAESNRKHHHHHQGEERISKIKKSILKVTSALYSKSFMRNKHKGDQQSDRFNNSNNSNYHHGKGHGNANSSSSGNNPIEEYERRGLSQFAKDETDIHPNIHQYQRPHAIHLGGDTDVQFVRLSTISSAVKKSISMASGPIKNNGTGPLSIITGSGQGGNNTNNVTAGNNPANQLSINSMQSLSNVPISSLGVPSSLKFTTLHALQVQKQAYAEKILLEEGLHDDSRIIMSSEKGCPTMVFSVIQYEGGGYNDGGDDIDANDINGASGSNSNNNNSNSVHGGSANNATNNGNSNNNNTSGGTGNQSNGPDGARNNSRVDRRRRKLQQKSHMNKIEMPKRKRDAPKVLADAQWVTRRWGTSFARYFDKRWADAIGDYFDEDEDHDWDINYDPMKLDDPRIRQGKHQILQTLPGYIISIIPYTEQKELKRELNEVFREQNPQLPVSLTLSKIRKLKRVALQVIRKIDSEISTAALGIIYFEKLVLKGVVNKFNRKLAMATCLLIAMKFNESGGTIMQQQQQQQQEHEQHPQLKPIQPAILLLVHELESEFGIEASQIIQAEFAVFAHLNFHLHVDQEQCVVHLNRLLKIMDASMSNSLWWG